MGKKDITEKLLEDYNDVFADIVNVLLFQGERIVRDEDLEPIPTHSVYKFKDRLHEQERDTAKFWKDVNVRIAVYGFENQTKIDPDMPLRIMGYDGASYRAQLLDKDAKERYPVITLVLYFGMQPWESPKALLDCFPVRDILRPYVSDYAINAFEIAQLSRETVNLFQSDFKIVADYFVQLRETGTYVGSEDELHHVHEVLQLMAALTDDERFEPGGLFIEKERGMNMCQVIDEYINKGRAEGRTEGKLDAVRSLLKKFTQEQAFDLLEIPAEERPQIAALLQSAG